MELSYSTWSSGDDAPDVNSFIKLGCHCSLIFSKIHFTALLFFFFSISELSSFHLSFLALTSTSGNVMQHEENTVTIPSLARAGMTLESENK